MHKILRTLEAVLWIVAGIITLISPQVGKWQFALAWAVLMSELIDRNVIELVREIIRRREQ